MIDPDDRRRPGQRDPDQAQAGRRRRRGPRQAASGASAPSSTASTPGATSKAPLLAAVQMETAILNVLLFMIIAVAGFGILAIFYMIVVEKTRDIGILKSLGASGRGVMGIFLAYGLSLGLVGSGVGMVDRPAVRPLHQRDRRRPGLAHRPAGVRPVDLLLLQDSHDRRCRRPSPGSWPGRWSSRCWPASCRPAAPPGCTPWRPCAMSNASRQHSAAGHCRRPRAGAARGSPRSTVERPPTVRHAGAAADAPTSWHAVDLHKSYRKGPVEVPVLRGVSLERATAASSWRSSGKAARARARCCTCWARSTPPTRAKSTSRASGSTTCPPRGRDALRNRQFGMIFQFYHLLPELTTLENVLAPLMIAARRLELSAGSGGSIGPRADGTAGTGRPGPPAEAPAARAVGRRDAAGGHRPGPDRPAPRCCWPTSRPATSTRPPARKSSASCEP